LTVTLPIPFRSSRRLEAPDAGLGAPGVALDLHGIELDEGLFAAWSRRVSLVVMHLGWPPADYVELQDAGVTTLAFTAPLDQLRTASAANEWALCSALLERDPAHWGALRDALRGRASHAPEFDERAALARFALLAMDEALQG
jgi:hypothetical protein